MNRKNRDRRSNNPYKVWLFFSLELMVTTLITYIITYIIGFGVESVLIFFLLMSSPIIRLLSTIRRVKVMQYTQDLNESIKANN